MNNSMQMSRVKEISVIICAYNAERFIRRCLNSILNQSILKKYPLILQIIVVDDCSTDQTRQILDEYAIQYHIFEVYQTPRNVKLGGARNLGLQYVKGRWISFLDADDALTSEFYEKLLERAEATGADMVGCYSMQIDDESGKILNTTVTFHPQEMGVLTFEKYRKLIFHWHTFWINIYRSELFCVFQKSIGERNFFPEDIFHEDEGAGHLLYLYAKHYEIVSEALHLRYEHAGQITKAKDIKRIRHIMQAACIFWDTAKKQPYYNVFRDEINYRFLYLYLFFSFENLLQMKTEEARKLCNEIVYSIKNLYPDILANKYISSNAKRRIRARIYLGSGFMKNSLAYNFFCCIHCLIMWLFFQGRWR